MKRHWTRGFHCSALLLTLSSGLYAQKKFVSSDSLAQKMTQPLTTAAPLLGGVNVSYIGQSMKGPDGNFGMQQLIIDESSPVYKVMQTRHPLLIKTGVRYQGLYLSGEKQIAGDNFHSISVPVFATYVFSRNTNITAIGLAGVASDFRRDLSASEIFYSAGMRLGLRQASHFKIGVTVIYSHTYAGNTLIPLPDIDWEISDKWKLEALMPFRTSLKYKLNKQQSLAITQGFISGSYRLNDSSHVGKYVWAQQVTSGIMYEHSFSRRWNLHVIGGYAFSSKLQVFRNDQRVGFDDFGALNKRVSTVSYDKGAVFAQVGLSFKW